MRILVTNDDGIHAEGLRLLEHAAHSLTDDVWVVAPEKERSGAGHSVSLAEPLRYRKLGDKRFATTGAPADCVLMAVNALMPDKKPDLVLSGVNAGYNIGGDLHYSGTVGAAREAALTGIPALAFSQAFPPRNQRPEDFDLFGSTRVHLETTLKQLVALPDRPPLLNINFPPCDPGAVLGCKVTRQGSEVRGVTVDERTDGRGLPYYWVAFRRPEQDPDPDGDRDALFKGYISITPVTLDLTADHQRADLAAALE